MKSILLHLNEEDTAMLEHLKPFAKTKTATRTLRFALKKTYEVYKDMRA